MKHRILTLALFLPATLIQAADWPSWRGDLQGSGKSTETDLPVKWGREENIRWRVELPDRGNSTPIVWGDRVFVTQPIEEENWRGLLCFDRKNGDLLWKNGLVYEKPERTHRDNPYCSASPATDGEIVVAAYGSAGVAAYDFEGKELWRRDLGAIDHVWGHSTSPLLYGDLCIHYHGPAENQSFLIALNKRTGETVWRWNEPGWEPGERTDGFRDRVGEGVIGSFSTPILIREGDRELLVMSFPMELKAFDPATGEVVWTAKGLNPLVYTSPLVGDGIIVAQGGYFGNSVGVTTAGVLLWQEVRHFGGIGTGVIKDGLLYAQDSGGIVHCVDISTGETLWRDRLPGAGKSWGSYTLVGDRIYTLSQAGDTVVFEANPKKLEVLQVNDIGEHTNSSLVASRGEWFIRTHEALWCVGD